MSQQRKNAELQTDNGNYRGHKTGYTVLPLRRKKYEKV